MASSHQGLATWPETTVQRLGLFLPLTKHSPRTPLALRGTPRAVRRQLSALHRLSAPLLHLALEHHQAQHPVSHRRVHPLQLLKLPAAAAATRMIENRTVTMWWPILPSVGSSVSTTTIRTSACVVSMDTSRPHTTVSSPSQLSTLPTPVPRRTM